MKVTNAQLTALLAQIGLKDVELVEDEASADFDLNTAVETIDGERGKILTPRLEENLRTELTRSIDGRRGGELRNHLVKVTGIPRKDVEAIASDADAIKAAMSYKVGQIEGANGDVKAQIEAIIAQHNEEKTKLSEEYEGKLTGERRIRQSRDIMDYIESSVLKDAPLLPKADRKILAQDLFKHYEELYTVKYDEAKKEMGFYSKENPEMPAMNNSLLVDPKAVGKTFLEQRGLWQTDTRNVSAAEAMKGLPTGFTPIPAATNQAEPASMGAQQTAQRQEWYKANGITV